MPFCRKKSATHLGYSGNLPLSTQVINKYGPANPEQVNKVVDAASDRVAERQESREVIQTTGRRDLFAVNIHQVTDGFEDIEGDTDRQQQMQQWHRLAANGDHCVKALHADAAKFYKNMDRHGNTSAASIPVALNELAENGQLQPGQLLACIGFGGGLTWGGAIFQYKE